MSETVTKQFLYMVRPDGTVEIDWDFDRPKLGRVADMLNDEPSGAKLYWLTITTPKPVPDISEVVVTVEEIGA